MHIADGTAYTLQATKGTKSSCYTSNSVREIQKQLHDVVCWWSLLPTSPHKFHTLLILGEIQTIVGVRVLAMAIICHLKMVWRPNSCPCMPKPDAAWWVIYIWRFHGQIRTEIFPRAEKPKACSRKSSWNTKQVTATPWGSGRHKNNFKMVCVCEQASLTPEKSICPCRVCNSE